MTILLKYSIKSDSCLSNIPPTLRELLNFTCQEKYEELYEKNAGKISLDDMCLKILNNLKDKDELLTQKRYLYMALIMADAVEPTIKKKLHKDNRSQKVFQLINYLLIQKKVNNNLLDQKKLIAKIEKALEKLFPEISFGLQEIDEAFDVFKNLVKTLVPSLSQNALLEILDDCFQGYAIFPGSENCRDLFNWWLLDVVPAVWNLVPPQQLYTIHGLQDYFDSHKEISSKKKVFHP
jgi:hypothetical protein